MTIVDAHQHYWMPSRGDYGWLREAPASLQRPFLPADLTGERAGAGVSRSILVQAAPTEAETRYLFELARTDPAVIGVVGWVDFEAPDACERIDALVRDGHGLLCGLRPMVQDIDDPSWLAFPELDAVFDHMVSLGLCFDALVTAPQMPALWQRLQRTPGLRVVIDHGAKPPIAGSDMQDWSEWIEVLAGLPEVHCKLSGLLTVLTPGEADAAITPCVARLFELFGADRLVWGSDWPVVTTHASYAHWLSLARQLTHRFAPGRESDVFGANALRFYRLDPLPSPVLSETPHE